MKEDIAKAKVQDKVLMGVIILGVVAALMVVMEEMDKLEHQVVLHMEVLLPQQQ